MESNEQHTKYMNEALVLANEAFTKDEVPVGAILLLNSTIISRAHNLSMQFNNATLHCEIICIKEIYD